MSAELTRRLKRVAEAKRFLDRAVARGNTTKIANCQRELAIAQRALAKAKKQQNAPSSRRGHTRRTHSLPPSMHDRPSIRDADTGVRFSDDPDAASKSVWIFKTGSSFHRRDCHIVEARDGAVRIPVATARARGLVRCMHCAPTVR